MYEKKRVACYCRVSTDSKEQENSLENQQGYFSDMIGKNADYTLFRVYSDKGVTGTKLEREGFNKMLEDAGLDCVEVNAENTRKGKFVWVANTTRVAKFDVIWVKNTSRFARNVLAVDIINELKSKQVYVEFLDINKSTANDSDMPVIQLFATFDEAESRDKSRKVKIGLEQSAKRGRLFINDNIYGYAYNSATKELTIRENEASVIVEIFTLYSEGMGTRRIAKHLEDSGKCSRNGIPFSYSTIKGILKNVRYAGFNVYNKYDRSGVFDAERHATMRHFDEWVITESDKVPAIISRELYDKCKAILESKKSHINNKGINRGKGEFAGLIYCAKCGATYNQTAAHGKRFFMCRTRKKDYKKACDSPFVSNEKILEAINEQISNEPKYMTISF